MLSGDEEFQIEADSSGRGSGGGGHQHMEGVSRGVVGHCCCRGCHRRRRKRQKKKWERIATLDLAVAIDWQLQATVGDGLWQFRPGGVEWPLARRQRLTLNWDSGPDNVCMSGAVLNHFWMRCSVFFRLHPQALALSVGWRGREPLDGLRFHRRHYLQC